MSKRTPLFFRLSIIVSFNAVVIAVALLLAFSVVGPERASIGGLFSNAGEEAKVTETVSENQEALLVLDVANEKDMREVIVMIEDLGGKIVHRYPNNILWGQVPTNVNNIFLVKQVSYNKIEENELSKFSLDKDELIGVAVWNQHFDATKADMSQGEKLINDDLEPAPYLQSKTGGQVEQKSVSSAPSEMNGAPRGAGFYDTSEFMIGDISIGVILPESDGAIDASTENWDSSREAAVASEIQNGLSWWAARESKADITFTYHFYYGRTDSRARTSYEPINRSADPYGGTGEDLWVNEIMTKFGYSDSLRLDKVRHFNNDLRNTDGGDWAVTYFVVDSANDTNGMFADGYFAYMWVGGPYSVMTYDNDGYGIGNMDAVSAHELGHGFYANDQY